MPRKRLILPLLATSCLGLVVWLGGAATVASGKATVHRAAKVTVVTVTAGKPSELSFKLSKTSSLPAGLVTFKVTNSGFGIHNFKICTSPVAGATKNACVGKATPMLKRGQSATLTVMLSKTGKYEFLCAVPGHAAAGMKGLLGVGVLVAQPVSTSGTTSTTTKTATTTPVTTTGGGGTSGPDGCPAGQTIVSIAADDHDDDDSGAPSDGDGCV